MQLEIISYNGTALNTGNYRAYFPRGSVFLQADSNVVEAARHGQPPIAVDKTFSSRYIPVHVKMVGTVHTDLAALKALFNTYDRTLRTLLVKDTANSDKNWYAMAYCVSQPDVDGDTVIFNLYVADGRWYESNQSSDSWSISTSGSTHSVTVDGTLATQPIFEITPTVAKAGGYTYHRYAIVYNPLTNAFPRYPYNVIGDLDTTALVNDTTVSNQLNGAITTTATTASLDVAVGGGLPTRGMGYVGSEQISWTAFDGTSMTGITRGIGGTTAVEHPDNAVVARSKILANGDDLRVIVNGAEVPRWFGSGSNAMNQTATRAWIVLDWLEKIELTVAAISTTGDITFQNKAANKKSLSRLPPSGQLLIESELATYTSTNVVGLQVDGETRGAKGTTAAAHADGVTARWIQYEIKVIYGNQDATTPTYDETKKPMFGPGTSSNVSWVYSGSFATNDGLRSAEWRPSRLKTLAKGAEILSKPYTADAVTFADPATEMGMSIASWLKGLTTKAENAQIEWRLTHPAGITTVTATGEKYRVSTSWPGSLAGEANGFQYSSNGTNWTSLWTEATPSAASAWEAWSSHSAVSLGGTYKHVRFYIAGGVQAGPGYIVNTEADAVTVALASGNVPQLTLTSEAALYYLDCKITNTSNSNEYIKVAYSMKLDQTLKIDCEAHRITLTNDNTVVIAVIDWSTVRDEWLNLLGGQANVLQFDDTGTAGVTFVTKWRDRQN